MPEKFGKYEYDLEKRLGNTKARTGEGPVYEGHDTETNTKVAVKVVIRNELTLKRFRNELKLLKRLEKMAEENPDNFNHLVKIHKYRASSTLLRFVAASFFVNPTVEFKYAMEYCNGGELRHYMPLEGLDVPAIQEILKQIASGLKTLRAYGIVHRDLKPANILYHRVNGERILKITDYGHSRVLDRNGLASSCNVGTTRYRAPEVFDPPPAPTRSIFLPHYAYGAKADLFSVGLILYECYTGTHPFLLHASHVDRLPKFYKNHAQGDLDACIRKGLGDKCPAELRDLVLNLLVKDPNDRMGFDRFLENPFFAANYGSPVKRAFAGICTDIKSIKSHISRQFS